MKPTHKPLAMRHRKRGRQMAIPTCVLKTLNPQEGDPVYFIQLDKRSVLITLDSGALK